MKRNWKALTVGCGGLLAFPFLRPCGYRLHRIPSGPKWVHRNERFMKSTSFTLRCAILRITYDVASTATSTVAVSLAVTNGAAAVSATSLTGAIGPGVATGTGKAIVWDAGADWHGNVAMLGYILTADDGVVFPTHEGFALIPAGCFTMGDQSSPLVPTEPIFPPQAST